MLYKIYCKNEIIAEFKYSPDRDYCIELLRKLYPDCKFTTQAKKCPNSRD